MSQMMVYAMVHGQTIQPCAVETLSQNFGARSLALYSGKSPWEPGDPDESFNTVASTRRPDGAEMSKASSISPKSFLPSISTANASDKAVADNCSAPNKRASTFDFHALNTSNSNPSIRYHHGTNIKTDAYAEPRTPKRVNGADNYGAITESKSGIKSSGASSIGVNHSDGANGDRKVLSCSSIGDSNCSATEEVPDDGTRGMDCGDMNNEYMNETSGVIDHPDENDHVVSEQLAEYDQQMMPSMPFRSRSRDHSRSREASPSLRSRDSSPSPSPGGE